MKKIISVLLSVVLLIPCVNLFIAPCSAQGITVSNTAELKEALSNAEENGTVYLKGGRYFFDETYCLENIKKNITLTCVAGETAVLTTAQRAEGWENCTVNGVAALCAPAGGKVISSLFSEEKALQCARLPETGFWYLDRPDLTDTVGKGQDLGTNGFYIHDLDYALQNPGDIAVRVVHEWVSELTPMVSFDPATGLIKTKKYCGRPNQAGDRYYLENVAESLDKPGEWCFNSAEDKIYYIPRAGETAKNVCLYAAYEAEMLKINNCSGITFKNIAFAQTGWEYGSESNLNTDIHIHSRTWETASFQGATEACGAITVTYSDHINFVNCAFLNIGCTAIKFFNGAENCKAENCLFDTLGASAVFAGGRYFFHKTQSNNPADYARNITVTNCEICNYGLKFFGACGITVAYCDGADISHNEIHDGYYTGISVGYCWLFYDNPTQNISVKDNLIYRIGHNMISDLGGIYLLGVQEGTVVSGNVVHDVTCYNGETGYAGDGIYLDSGCEFMTIENNLVFNCDTSAFNNTLNKNNIVRNNIFAFAGQSAVCLGVSAYGAFQNLHSAYYNNILLVDGTVPALEYLNNPKHFCGHNNIVWNVTNEKELYVCEGHYSNGKSLWQTAVNKSLVGSAVIADPGFTDAAAYDFSFKTDSYATSHGFEPFDYGNAGTLPRTVIGFSKQGGQTPYYAHTAETQTREIALKKFEKVKAFFCKIGDYLKAFAAKIKGLTQSAVEAVRYQSFFASRQNNENTAELENLFNEVKKHTPAYRVDESRKPFAEDNRIRAIYFDGEICQGKETEIFAYYGLPEGACAADPVPAVVLVHGGGLYAQADWVRYWVDRGYAALAIDGFGQEPLVGEYKSENENWVQNPNSHMGYNGFDDCNKPFTEQWFYYYITDIILANSLLRNENCIVHNQIGVSGISWGGIATSTVMGYDERFAFAVPIYGCPYSADSAALSETLFVYGAENVWEPSLRLADVKMPVFLINGNADPFFAPDCTTTSAAEIQRGSLLFLNGLVHGEFKIEEAVRFANEYTGRGEGNIHITDLSLTGRQAKIAFTLPADVGRAKVTLYVRKGEFAYKDRELTEGWKAISCVCGGTDAKVTVPEDALYYYFDVTAHTGNGWSKNTLSASTGIYCTES